MHTIEPAKYFGQVGHHDEQDWKPVGWEGIYNTVLYELARVSQVATLPVHYHPTVTDLFLVSGPLRDENLKRVITRGHLRYQTAGRAARSLRRARDPSIFMGTKEMYFHRTDGKAVLGQPLDFDTSGENLMMRCRGRGPGRASPPRRPPPLAEVIESWQKGKGHAGGRDPGPGGPARPLDARAGG